MSHPLPAGGRPVRSTLAACVAALVLLAVSTAAAQPPGRGTPSLDLFNLGGPDREASAEEPAVEVRLTPETVRPGGEVMLSITLRVPPGKYTYSISPDSAIRTSIHVTKAAGLEPLGEGFRASHQPKPEFEPNAPPDGGIVEKHLRDVTWSRQYRVTARGGETVEIAGRLTTQLCDENTCLPLREEIAASALVPRLPPGNEAGGAAGATRSFQHEERPGSSNQPGPAVVRAELAPRDAKPGDRVRLSVSVELDEGWHTYAVWEKRVLGAAPTKLEVAALRGLKPLSDAFAPDRQPERKQIPELNVVHEVFHDRVTWSREFEVTAADYGLSGSITYQTCDDRQCLLPRTVQLALGDAPEPSAATPAPDRGPGPAPAPVRTGSGPTSPPADRGTAPGPPPQIVPRDAGAADPATDPAGEADPAGTSLISPGSDTPKALIPFLLAAIGFGFASLFTPCVFPMIPITVSYFLKESEKEHHQPVTMALVYCGGIVATFTALGLLMSALFGVSAMQGAANNPWLNLFFAGVLVFFALNMLGMFEIRVPSWLLNWSSGKEAQGGFIGVLFMAFTFTLVSFTCTFAFAGTLLLLASHGEYYWATVGMLAFSGAFALPFFFLAVFPSYLQKLPKSGGWMNRTKVTMGMIELALVFKFLSVADFSLSASTVVFDYAMVMTAWIILSVVTGLYLLGLFRLPHDTASDNVSVPRFMFALFLLSFGAYLAVGVFSPTKPRGAPWAYLESFAPPDLHGGTSETLGPFLTHDNLEYALDYEQALRYAKQNGTPVFLDFTGVNCVNCRLMEKRMERPELRERLAKFIRVQVFTDVIPPPVIDRDEVAALLDKNIRLQTEWFRDPTLPSYAIVTPDRQILARLSGQNDAATFARFLDDGLAEWQRLAARDSQLARR